MTQPSDFTLEKGQKVTVPLMQKTGGFPYFEDSDLQVLELPYAGDELSMLILLPRKAEGLPVLEKSLTAERLADIESKLLRGSVEVHLPRFKITSSFGLIRSLRELGMELPFTPEADFSGMDGKKDLLISMVAHKAYVDVNEKGTEAAAATAVVGTLTSAIVRTKQFRADHPFLFLIRHKRSGSILFMGRVQNPNQ
jgi:serpin B